VLSAQCSGGVARLTNWAESIAAFRAKRRDTFARKSLIAGSKASNR